MSILGPYFPTGYFPGQGGGGGLPIGVPAPIIGAIEWAILDDVVARLAATGVFGEQDGSARVGWGATLEVLFPEQSGPAAAVEYLGKTESPVCDVDFLIVDGRYSLTLAVIGQEPRERGVLLAELAGIARDVLSNVMLGGICQPYFCRLREDTPTAAGHPEGRLRLAGTYRYTVIDDLSRDETGDI